MSGTVEVTELRPLDEVHECSGCLARWIVPLGGDEDEAAHRDECVFAMLTHECDPSVDVERVREVRERASLLASRIEDDPIPGRTLVDEITPEMLEVSREWNSRADVLVDQLARDSGHDVGLLSAAATVGLSGMTTAEQLIWRAKMQAWHRSGVA